MAAVSSACSTADSLTAMRAPLLIAAPASGSGKTTVTLGLLAALRRRGVVVAPFKVGPDFIDPGHHALAVGRTSFNLDGWMCGCEAVQATFAGGCAGADLALIEGVMGLFDGADGASDAGSSAEIAHWLGGRIVLVIDARAQARSVAALVKGFVDFDLRLQFAGVVLNRVGSPRHEELLRDALASVPGLPPLLGCLPRDAAVELPERHLGLVTAEDAACDYDKLGAWVERHVNVAALLASPPLPKGGQGGFSTHKEIPLNPPLAKGEAQPAVRIGVARDAAFCFCYPENLQRLQQAGAELQFFSPLDDAVLPAALDGLYLPGGYPELHAARLAANDAMLEQIRAFARAGKPIYAECGGLVYLAQGVGDHDLVGIFPGRARMLPRRQALGYREVTFARDTLLGPAGSVARGHEFHYSQLELPETVACDYRLTRRGVGVCADEGYRIDNVLGSYVHLHFASNDRLAVNFVNFCKDRRFHHEEHEGEANQKKH